MRKAVLLLGLVLFGLPLFAESPGTWAGFITYAPKPAATAVVIPRVDLAWLADTANLVEKGGFTFLGRKDADHWAALTNQGTSWVLQIHDETALFDFRATVVPATGALTVQKGVDWVGTSRQADADWSARTALGYLTRARTDRPLFGPAVAGPPTSTAPTRMDLASREKPGSLDKPKAMTPSEPAHEAAHEAAPEPALGAGGASLWQRLADGNLRFVSGKVTHPNQSMARIAETAKAQKPFAIVVTCSDSRVPPEILFDQGLGDLFVVRTAGEVVTEVELGSIEYAVEHLGATYLVVLGHERCGAVDATLKGGDLPPNIEAIAAQIRPAVEAARFLTGDPLDNAVRENAERVLAKIKATPALAEAMHEGKLNAKAAYYDLDTGKVASLP